MSSTQGSNESNRTPEPSSFFGGSSSAGSPSRPVKRARRDSTADVVGEDEMDTAQVFTSEQDAVFYIYQMLKSHKAIKIMAVRE
ncbi:hypothetical protein FPSE_11200 [Fusarium pseudograminearum CS3096]|uniref:Uncharacterized protein n=1 Tax=Fusarium pseudograminearum (strain CS3096) TaxID=1028729 RepID=K3V6A8_FUSPC|nr:hypothetical protein FPSE_11200 [Fusarium pseudograminearum CS3096]EKJ68624.1 hypothetical protein FPSE_11200 [Fusarium pseudograminearum CS3096]